ncbi:hypothetical protein [Actinophytocola gossypii]|uniref:Uncharacterized protein n=1 Tax=Actinophytocola gossypii TaxID=2812003 RepID=A0ABT2J3G0_9PSEU|nr:hypothetical protein [Actinophytocola gossypii]MCT2582388.1 hypothetical protein [Actinophytocola gossypii]
MSLPRAAVFTAKIAALLGAAAIAIAAPITFATGASADDGAPPPPPPTTTTEGHDWSG